MTISVVVPITDIDNTVLIPVCRSVISTLMFSTGIELDTQTVVMKPRGGEAAQYQTINDNETLQLNTKPHIEFEYKEVDHPIEFHYNKYQAYEFPAIFDHPELGIRLSPLYHRVKLEITINYHHPNWNAIKSWIRLMKIRNLKENPDAYHNVFYHFIIPADINTYLTAAWVLSEKVAGYGINLTNFLKRYSNENFGLIENQIGTNKDIIVSVKNSNVLGQYTSEFPDEPDTSHETSTSNVEFTFELTFDSPVAILLQYQKYIHNQELDTSFLLKYADRRNHHDSTSGTITYSQSVRCFSDRYQQYFTSDLNNNGLQLVQQNKDTVNNQPADLNFNIDGDGWYPTTKPKYMAELITFPIQLDSTNLQQILDLHHLTSIGFPNWMINLFKKYFNRLTIDYGWVFYIELFAVGRNVVRIPLSVDENLNVRSLSDMNLRDRHYFRVLLNTDLVNVDLTALQKEPNELLRLLQYINPDIELTTIGNGSFVTNQSLLDAKKKIKRLYNDGISGRNVMLSSIAARIRRSSK